MDIVFNDPNLLGLVLIWLKRDKHITLYICQRVNRLFYRIINDSIDPKFNLIGAWMEHYLTAPVEKTNEIIRQMAKRHIVWKVLQPIPGLILWHAYYGFAEGIKARLNVLDEEEVVAEMNFEIPNKYSREYGEKPFCGIFELIAHSGNFECFKLTWDWYLTSQRYLEDESEFYGDTFARNHKLHVIYEYGRLEMILYAKKDICLISKWSVGFDLDAIFGINPEYYDRKNDSSKARELRIFEMLKSYALEPPDAQYYSRLLTWTLVGYRHQHRTFATRAWEYGIRITGELYFSVLKHFWHKTVDRPEENIIEDIRFVLNLGVDVHKENILKIIEEVEKNNQPKIAKFLLGLIE